jgi:glycine betaine/proline transport system substrate-binding protein
MGGNERPTAIAREGLKDELPDAYAFLNALALNEAQLGKLELTINDAKGAEVGVREWLKNNRDVVQPWVDAAKKARKS